VAAQRVAATAERPQVLGAGQPLLDAAEQPGGGRALLDRLWHRGVAQPHHHDGGDGGEGQQGQADPPVLHGDHHQDTDQGQPVADHVGRERRQELRQGGDVAVDPLDQLTGRVGAVEGEVLPERVGGQLAAQLVGGGPGQPRGPVGGRHRQRLPGQRDRDVGAGDARQDGRRPARHRPVDERAQELRAGQRQRRAGGEHRGEQGDTPEHRAQQRGQRPPVGAGSRHGTPTNAGPRGAPRPYETPPTRSTHLHRCRA
jgi:hypothetical protein